MKFFDGTRTNIGTIGQNIPPINWPSSNTPPQVNGMMPNMCGPIRMQCKNICNPIVIAGYPGVGKSVFYENSKKEGTPESKYIVYDSDSSKYKQDWPFAYIDHILELVKTCSRSNELCIIFVSTHKEVLRKLIEHRIRFYICYPDIRLKDAYLDRYRSRGSTDEFINLMDKKWLEFHNDIEDILLYKLSTVYSIRFTSDKQNLSTILRYYLKTRSNLCSKNLDIFPFLPITMNKEYLDNSEIREFLLRCLDDYYMMCATIPLCVIESIVNFLNTTISIEDKYQFFMPIYQKIHRGGLI